MRARRSASSAPRGEPWRRVLSISARLRSSHSCQAFSVAMAVTPILSVRGAQSEQGGGVAHRYRSLTLDLALGGCFSFSTVIRSSTWIAP